MVTWGGGTRRQASTLALLLAALAAGCAGSKESSTGSAALAATAAAAAVPAAVDDCPGTGLWKPCVLIDRLVHAGLAPHAVESDSTRVPFLAPTGLHYRIGKSSTLIAFFFNDSLQATKAWEALDTLRFSAAGDTTSPWPKPPAAMRAGNLVAAVLSESPRQIERIRLVLAAGLPAPPRASKERLKR